MIDIYWCERSRDLRIPPSRRDGYVRLSTSPSLDTHWRELYSPSEKPGAAPHKRHEWRATPPTEDATQFCPACGRDTPHAVTIELRTERPDADEAHVTRQPYVVATWRACGEETVRAVED